MNEIADLRERAYRANLQLAKSGLVMGTFGNVSIADRERGALKRVAAECKRIGAHFYHQSDPRGCVLYIGAEPMSDSDYHRGVAAC